MERQQKRIVIVGAGIMGASVAYHLAEQGYRATLFDSVGVAAAASGKAGGFLARDWARGPQRDLARASFALHEKLARDLQTDIGYRHLDAFSVGLAATSSAPSPSSPSPAPAPELKWLNGRARPVGRAGHIANPATCAQVTPRLLTEALVRAARTRVGTDVVIARVVGVRRASRHWELRVEHTSSTGTAKTSVVKADMVALCMGPWTNSAHSWFSTQLPPISPLKGVSLVTPVRVPATALFTQYKSRRGDIREPEAYPRENELYVCQKGVPDDLVLLVNTGSGTGGSGNASSNAYAVVPPRASKVTVHKRDAAELVEFACGLSTKVEEAVTRKHRTQACYLPISPDGAPLIGNMPGCDGVFVATGHSFWGILNGPATGKALAEIMVHGKSSIDVRAFDPRRFY